MNSVLEGFKTLDALVSDSRQGNKVEVGRRRSLWMSAAVLSHSYSYRKSNLQVPICMIRTGTDYLLDTFSKISAEKGSKHTLEEN